MKKIYKIGIIGCGLIGNKRASSLGKRGKVYACADIDVNKAEKLAAKTGASAFQDWKKLISIEELDVVIVSTLHNKLAEITIACIKNGKHVLVEKPAARNYKELNKVIELQKKHKNIKVRVGFNHRFHPAFIQAKKIIDKNQLGDLMYIRGRYGHGGRLGYENEWRANPSISGGGELIDQGSHLIDLSRFFLGDFNEIQGHVSTFFWNMPVEDNGFMTLKTDSGKVAFLHASCTEWKNLFSFEIYGQRGKLDISGLGGSYGIEKVTFYKMLKEMGPPKTKSWEYPLADNSWKVEMNEFYKDIDLKREPTASLSCAFENLKIINKLYLESGYDYSS